MSTSLRSERPSEAPSVALDHLTDGIERELALVRDLRETLAVQRAAIAACDTAAVQETCDRVAQTLQAMERARTVRVAALDALGVPPDTLLADLPSRLGGSLPPALEAARLALRAEAESAATDAAVHQRVLRRTVESGDAYLQALFSSTAEPEPVYRTGERAADGQPGFLLDRKA